MAEWFEETAARTRRQLDRYLNLDGALQYALASVDAFAETYERAAGLGFTDLVVRWPRAGGGEARYEAVVERVAAELRLAADRPG